MATKYFTRRLGAAASACVILLAATSLPAQAAASGSSAGAGSVGSQSTGSQIDGNGVKSGANRMGSASNTGNMGAKPMAPTTGAQNVSPPGPDSSTGTSPSAGPHVPGDQNSSDSVGQ